VWHGTRGRDRQPQRRPPGETGAPPVPAPCPRSPATSAARRHCRIRPAPAHARTGHVPPGSGTQRSARCPPRRGHRPVRRPLVETEDHFPISLRDPDPLVGLVSVVVGGPAGLGHDRLHQRALPPTGEIECLQSVDQLPGLILPSSWSPTACRSSPRPGMWISGHLPLDPRDRPAGSEPERSRARPRVCPRAGRVTRLPPVPPPVLRVNRTMRRPPGPEPRPSGPWPRHRWETERGPGRRRGEALPDGEMGRLAVLEGVVVGQRLLDRARPTP
jgi:hypothetical protein